MHRHHRHRVLPSGLLLPASEADSGLPELAPLHDLQESHRQLAARRAYLPQNPHLEWPLPVERLVALGVDEES